MWLITRVRVHRVCVRVSLRSVARGHRHSVTPSTALASARVSRTGFLMLTYSIDSDRLVKDIEAIVADCIHLKSALRTRWTKPMAEEQKQLIRVRRALTERFILLAASRRRIHIIHAPRQVRDQPGFDAKTWDAAAYNATIATRLLPEYTDGAPLADATTTTTTTTEASQPS
jgi:hypothetical protein